MNAMILDGLPHEFDTLAAQAALGDDVEAKLAALVERTREAAGTGPNWQQQVQAIRGNLKLTSPPGQVQRAFYADAIARLSALIEGE